MTKKKKNPKMSFSNVNKTLGKLWSELNDTDRKIYQDHKKHNCLHFVIFLTLVLI